MVRVTLGAVVIVSIQRYKVALHKEEIFPAHDIGAEQMSEREGRLCSGQTPKYESG